MYKSSVKEISYFQKPTGEYVIQLTVPKGLHINDLPKIAKTADYVELKKHRKKRSLDANAALWVMLQKIAVHQKTTKDELYEHYVRLYGVSKIVGVSPSAIEAIKRLSGAKFFTIRGERTQADKKMIYLELHFGSSGYNREEMSRLLDHVIEDAKEMGIDYLSASERDLIIEEWDHEFKTTKSI